MCASFPQPAGQPLLDGPHGQSHDRDIDRPTLISALVTAAAALIGATGCEWRPTREHEMGTRRMSTDPSPPYIEPKVTPDAPRSHERELAFTHAPPIVLTRETLSSGIVLVVNQVFAGVFELPGD